MKILAVTRFTLLRLWRTHYWLAAAMLFLLVFGVQWLGGDGTDMSLGLSNLMGRTIVWLSAIWLGISLVHADRSDGTLRSTLTRPISLAEILIGKLLGGLIYLTVLAVGLTLAILLGAMVGNAPLRAACVLYQVHLLPIHLTVMALAMLLSLVMPRFAAGLLVLSAWDDWLLDKFTLMASKLTPLIADALIVVVRVVYTVLPPTSRFYIRYEDFAYKDLPTLTYMLLLPYSVHYAIAACLLGAWALRRQEL